MNTPEIILYPTETVYALGVNAFDADAWRALCVLKGREVGQTASWLVRDVADVERFAEVLPPARQLVEEYLPGPLTLVLKAKLIVPAAFQAADGTVSFRISSDPFAQALIAEYMERSGGVPLTCTSANVHGLPTLPTVPEIVAQFGERAGMVTKIVDGGARSAPPSTIVRCLDNQVEVLRQGVLTIP